jgi:Protein of unknown function (DUF2934)
MNYDFGTAGESATSFLDDAAFEQLLRQTASYASRQRDSAQGAGPLSVTKDPPTAEIERRAYQIYIGRGGSDGHDLDDWLQAERQLAEELKRKR